MNGVLPACATGLAFGACLLSLAACRPSSCSPDMKLVDELKGVTTPGDFNVRDFGAIGDGVHDDTAAIAAAGKAAQAHDDGQKLGFEAEGAHAEVVFPAGTYRLTDTVFLGRCAHFRALGDVTLAMDDSTKDILYLHRNSRTRLEGLKFRGGRNQVNQATLNFENANLFVRGCAFEGAASNAIRSVSRRLQASRLVNVGGNECAIGEFEPDEKGVFRPNPEYPVGKMYANSTFILVEDCSFDGCAHAMDFHSDGTVVRNCTVRQPAVAGAVFRFTTNVHFYGLDVTVERGAGLEQCVFSPYGTTFVAVEDSTFRTTDGRGVLLVDSSIRTSGIPGNLLLRNCTVACGGAPEGAIVRCRENTCPGLLIMDGIHATGGRRVRAVAFEKELTEAQLHAANKNFDHVPLEKIYHFSFGALSPNVVTDGGDVFNRFVRPFPSDLPRPPIVRKPLRVYAGKVLRATDFGVDLEAKTDDTEAMERFVAALAREPGAVGLLPGERITVSRPLVLDGDFALVGSGTPRFVQKDTKSPLFAVVNGSRVKLRNMLFLDGRQFVKFDVDEAKPTEILVDNCFGFNTFRWDKHDGAWFEVSAKRRSENVSLTITGGSYYQPILYRGNARTLMDGFWFRSWAQPAEDRPLTASTTMINLPGGVLRAVDILGVPCTLRRWGWTANDPKVDKGDYRWIDNFGVFHSEFFRYGGEYGGLVPVYAFGDAQTYIEGGFSEFKAFRCRQSIIYSDGDACRSQIFGTLFLSRPPLADQDRRIRSDCTIWLRQ